MNRRILLIDDNGAIHDDFRKILTPSGSGLGTVDREADELFGEATSAAALDPFEVDSAHQGQDALEMVKKAVAAGRPYAMAFVDMQMPPGWDGLTTISRLWAADPDLQTVICTAYSDRSWGEIQAVLTARDRWLVLKKPFDMVEVLQLAHALTEKWNLSQLAKLKLKQLQEMVESRTAELQDAHRVKTQFLANASHEMLTPLNGIIGLLEMLADSPLNDEQRSNVDSSSDCAKDLLRLITRMLEFNSLEVEAPSEEVAEFDVVELLRTVVEGCKQAASAKGLVVRIDTSRLTEDRVLGQARVIGKTLALLSDNAVKFTATGSVTLAAETVADGLTFSVSDTGRGLTAEDLRLIQHPFAQVHGGSNRSSSGFGLGLPLARRLLRTLHSELVLATNPDGGVTASFVAKVSPAVVA